MTIPTMPPPDAGEAPPPRSDRFFLWIAGLGIARSDGWIGGVAAGIAARLRIDPLIVRGVLVVAALFGLPVIFLYAIAWALLPDADGRVHARDLIRGDFQPVQIGILATAVIGLVPSAPVFGGWIAGFWYNPYQYGWFNSFGWSPLSILGWIVGLALAGVLLFLIVRAARRTPGAAAPYPSMASTDSAAPDASVGVDGSGTVDATDAIESDAGALADSAAPASALIDAPAIGGTASTASPLEGGAPAAPPIEGGARAAPPIEGTAPAAPPAGEQTPDALEAWRQQHAAWKEQDQAWRRQQQDAERAARDQARHERQAVAATFAAEAAERRRIRRASNPRARFAFVASAIGLAIVVGAAVALGRGLGTASFALALFAAALTLASAMIVAGIARRRSGFLAFLTTITLLGAIVAGGFASLADFRFGWTQISNAAPADITQPFGHLNILLYQHDDAPRPIEVDKASGSTYIDVDPGVQLDLHARVDSTVVHWTRVELFTQNILDSGTWEPVERGGELVIDHEAAAERTDVTTVQPLAIEQSDGEITVTIYEPEDGEQG